MKKYILLFLCLITVSGSFAQMKDFKFKFYGQIRTDLYYNSRANQETVDGLFYMYLSELFHDSRLMRPNPLSFPYLYPAYGNIVEKLSQT